MAIFTHIFIRVMYGKNWGPRNGDVTLNMYTAQPFGLRIAENLAELKEISGQAGFTIYKK